METPNNFWRAPAKTVRAASVTRVVAGVLASWPTEDINMMDIKHRKQEKDFFSTIVGIVMSNYI